jgi:hypothetical protein
MHDHVATKKEKRKEIEKEKEKKRHVRRTYG